MTESQEDVGDLELTEAVEVSGHSRVADMKQVRIGLYPYLLEILRRFH